MSKIESIKFEVIDPIVIKKTAGCEVTSSGMYQVENPDVPVRGGLFDLKMGTVDSKQLCATCKGTPASCPGHHGYIELDYPCYNPTFLEGNTLVYVLKSVCHGCSKLFPSQTESKSKGINYLPMYAKGIKQSICKNCGGQRASNIKYTDAEMHVRYTDMSVKVLDTETVLELLKKVTQQDCDTLGVYHPQRMIWTVLPVIPPVTRTHAVFGGISKSANELTTRYQQIIDQNNIVKEFKIAQPQNVAYQAKLLQRLVSSLTKTETRLVPGPQVAAVKSMSDLIMKKDGIIRNNLMGKRVNYSGRTVIGLDTTLALDQVGVPKFVASVLTTPEKVTLNNIQHLQTLVNLGPNRYPGATFVELPDGSKINLKQSSSVVFLQVGHIVHRYLMDDDPVFLNRQPSLHKYSMMGHRAKVLEGNTFRVNLSANKPYNADYDGDEVNLHLPQDQLSKVELQQIANIGNLVISTGVGAPIMSIVLDALLGSFLMTLPDTVVSREDFMNMIIDFDQALLHDHSLQLRHGRDLIMYSLPQEMYYTGNSKVPQPLESKVVIQDSRLLQGVLSGNILGTSKGELIHNIAVAKGSRAAADFITGLQRIANAFMVRRGFSLGIRDALLGDSELQQIDKLVEEVTVKVDSILDKARQGIIKMCPGMTPRESLEQDIRDTAEIAVKYANSAITALGMENNYVIQVLSGVKGKIDNLKNIMAIVGQLTIDGNRIKPGYTHRLTPHFFIYVLVLYCRGFF
jgi:DNA-directed RNA polymerase II subunit RPB1